MKPIQISCEHCAHRIHFHDLFRRDDQTFYHALCWELSLVQRRDKMRVGEQGQLSPMALPPSPRHGSDYC